MAELAAVDALETGELVRESRTIDDFHSLEVLSKLHSTFLIEELHFQIQRSHLF